MGVPGRKNLNFKLHKDIFFPLSKSISCSNRVWVKRAVVSVVKLQTVLSPQPTTSSHGSMLRFLQMQMGDVIHPARPDSALGSLPGLARRLNRFSSWCGGTAAPLWPPPRCLSSSPSLRSCSKWSLSSFQSFVSQGFILLLPAKQNWDTSWSWELNVHWHVAPPATWWRPPPPVCTLGLGQWSSKEAQSTRSCRWALSLI